MIDMYSESYGVTQVPIRNWNGKVSVIVESGR